MVVTDQRYRVTGELTPDVTGDFEPIGPYADHPSYELGGNGWFIWWHFQDAWVISQVRGTFGVSSWLKPTPGIEGTYTHQGEALGDAEVAEI